MRFKKKGELTMSMWPMRTGNLLWTLSYSPHNAGQTSKTEKEADMRFPLVKYQKRKKGREGREGPTATRERKPRSKLAMEAPLGSLRVRSPNF